jgi:hypothetical protein
MGNLNLLGVEGKKSLGRTRHRLGDHIKMEHKKLHMMV